MAKVVEVDKTSIACTELSTAIEFIVDKVNKSSVFKNKQIYINYLDIDKPCINVHVNNGGYKAKEYITGEYQVVIDFTIVNRSLLLTDSSDRLEMINEVNALGSYLESNSFEGELSHCESIAFVQMTLPTTTFRNTVVEDISSTFVLSYDTVNN